MRHRDRVVRAVHRDRIAQEIVAEHDYRDMSQISLCVYGVPSHEVTKS
jgi:hypothetical protein